MAISARPIRATWKRRHWTLTPSIGSLWLHESLAHYSRSTKALRGESSKIAFAFSQLLCALADIADVSNTVTPCNAPLCLMHQESLPSKHGSYLNAMLENVIPPTTLRPAEGGNPRAVIVTKPKGRARNNWTWWNLYLQGCEEINKDYYCVVSLLSGPHTSQDLPWFKPIFFFCALIWAFIGNRLSVTSATCIVGPSVRYMPAP